MALVFLFSVVNILGVTKVHVPRFLDESSLSIVKLKYSGKFKDIFYKRSWDLSALYNL